MRKQFLWMLVAFLICGANMMTSCSNEDIPVVPNPQLPDQASMFVQNVLSDARYTPDLFQISSQEGETVSSKIIRLDVNSYEEALAEFLKLLPEGVAETAFAYDDYYKGLFSSATAFSLNAPLINDKDTICICKTNDIMASAIGYAWVELTEDLQKALGAEQIIYMVKTDNDDMANFISSLMNIIPYCTPDANDPSHLICTFPNSDVYMELALAFITTKMMMALVPDENGDGKVAMTDGGGNLYGYMYILSPEHKGDALAVYVLDEDLQASLAKQIGGAFSKISFFLAEDE